MTKYLVSAQGINKQQRQELENELNHGKKKYVVTHLNVRIDKI